LAIDSHRVMLGNLRRLTAQAEAADAAGDHLLALGLWRAAQSHAKSLAPFDPDSALPVIESIMDRFEAQAAVAADHRQANQFHRLAQSAATDLAPFRLSRVPASPDATAEDAAEALDAAYRLELQGKTLAELHWLWENDPEVVAARAAARPRLEKFKRDLAAAPPSRWHALYAELERECDGRRT
jgi:hypothetical protein